LIYEQIINVINKSSKIAVTSHVVPDGDNVGSSLALCHALKKLSKHVTYLIDDNIPEVYKFLKGAREVERLSSFADLDYDLVIAMDCGDLERLGKVKQLAEKTRLINIDHHISNTKFGEINLVEENASATAEIAYKLIKSMGIFIDKDIAECIYTGIVTDTGMFQYSNTSQETHSIAAELIIAGVAPADIFNKIYQNSPKEKVLLMKEALQSLEFHFNDKVSCIAISKEQIDNIAKEDLDTEGIVNMARDIANIEVAVFLKEKEANVVKASLRSKSYVDVCAIAKGFGGGGHIRAAGCTISGSLEQVKMQILQALQKQI
jgi:phosphoesterase RecJ-like protein